MRLRVRKGPRKAGNDWTSECCSSILSLRQEDAVRSSIITVRHQNPTRSTIWIPKPSRPTVLRGRFVSRRIEEFRQRAPTVTQVACFDTAFHRDLPDVARRLPLPRRYYEQGVRRYGFHGLSFAFLMEELTRQSGGSPPPRVVLAHLGNGSSLAAVRDGSCIDTSMGFTPAGGIPMSTRSGDLDPGVIQYLWATDGMTPQTLRELTNCQAGLLGVSEVSGDLRELLAREPSDPRCHEAIDIFCYAVRKPRTG